MKGTVKWFSEEKGYGFIKGEDGQDVFVHATKIEKNVRLTDGVPVEFETFKGNKGTQAKNVRTI